jgi:hypothetical protein
MEGILLGLRLICRYIHCGFTLICYYECLLRYLVRGRRGEGSYLYGFELILVAEDFGCFGGTLGGDGK